MFFKFVFDLLSYGFGYSLVNIWTKKSVYLLLFVYAMDTQ